MRAQDVVANLKLMHQRAQDLSVLLNRLAWPEILGPYFPKATAKHVVQGPVFTVAINYDTAMFTRRSTLVHHFIDLPKDDGNTDVVAWLATEFLAWVTEQYEQEKKA